MEHVAVEILIKDYHVNDFDKGLLFACRGGHIELAEILIKVYEVPNIDRGLHRACFGGEIN
jgi:hypothetical protein